MSTPRHPLSQSDAILTRGCFEVVRLMASCAGTGGNPFVKHRSVAMAMVMVMVMVVCGCCVRFLPRSSACDHTIKCSRFMCIWFI